MSPSTGSISEYSIPTADSGPYYMADDLQGNLWFTESSANKLAKIDIKSGDITEVPVPTTNSSPLGIVEGPMAIIGLWNLSER